MTILTILYIVSILALVSLSAAIGLALLEKTAVVLKQIGIDVIELYARATQAKNDNETRRAKLDYWQDYAQMALRERRQKLIGDGEK